MEPPLLPRSRRVLRRTLRAFLSTLLLFSALLFLCEKEIIPWPRRTIEIGQFRAAKGFGYTTKLPAPWPGFTFVPHSALFTEDGRPLTPVPENGEVREKGHGTFRLGTERLLFSSTDATNPLTNGRAYRLRLTMVIAPRLRPAILLAGGGAALLLCEGSLLALFARCRRGALRLAEKPAAVSFYTWAWMLFFAALAIRLGFLWLNPDYTDRQMSIRGTPFSDARDWLDMAKSTATGRGVDTTYPGMRALYPMFLASFFTWTGDSVPLAKALQALLGAISTVLVFLLLRRAMPLWPALAAAVFFAADPRQITQAGKLMTEPFGLLLTMLSAWCLMLGGERRRPALLFAAGAFFACSNLARPLTLFAFPIFIALIATNAWLRDSGRWRAAFIHATAFALGTVICLAPWVIRERAVHGIWAISCNSSSALFAASTPEFGVWQTRVEDLAAKAGVSYQVKARYEFFQERFRENLKKFPGFYASNIIRSFRGATTESANFPPPLRSAALVLAIVGAAFTLWWRTFPGAVLIVSHFSGLLGSALFGNPDLQRVRLLIDWIEAGGTFVGIFAVTSVVLKLTLRLPLSTNFTVSEEPSPLWLRWIGRGFTVFLLVSAARLVFLNTFAAPPPSPRARFSDGERTAFIREITTRFPEWQGLADPALMAAPHGWKRRAFVEFGTIEKDVYRFPAHTGFQHPSGRFEPRPYLHTSCVVRLPGAGTAWMEFAGEIPLAIRDSTCLLIGLTKFRPAVATYLENSVECVAIVPASDFKPDFSRALTAPVFPDTEAPLQPHQQ